MTLLCTLLALAVAQDPGPTEVADNGEWRAPVLLVQPSLPGTPAGSPPVRVTVLLVVDETGAVVSARPLQGPEPELSIAVMQASGLRFSPARESGRPVAVEVPFTWSFPVEALETEIRIRVRAAGRGTPLAGVQLLVDDQLYQSDSDGLVELTGLSEGPATVALADPSWTGRPAEITIPASEIIEVELFASPTWAGEAVGLYSSASPDPRVRRLTRDRLAAEPGAMGDPVRALQNLPGLVRTPLDAGWVLSRGGGIDDTQVFVDGVEVPLLFHLGGLTSIVHPRLVGELSYTPGLPSAERGNTLSGAAEITTAASDPGTELGGGINLAFAHGYASHGTEDRGVTLGARRSYLDAVLAAALGDEAGTIAPQFWDLGVRAHLGGTDATLIAIFDRAVTPGETPEDPIVISQASAVGTSVTEGHWRAAAVSLQPWVTFEQRELQTTIREESLRSTRVGGRVMAEWGTPRASLATGLEGNGQAFTLLRNSAFRQSPLGTVAPFLRTRGQLGTFEGEAHLRVETLFIAGQRPRHALSPRLAARWTPPGGLVVSLETGQLVQAPDLLATVAFPEGAYLDLETSRNTSLTAEWRSPRHGLRGAVWQRRASLYGYELDGSLGPLSGRAQGLELSSTHRSGPFEGRSIVQITRSAIEEDEGEPLRPTLYDQPLRLHVQAQLDLAHQWSIGARARYGSGFYNVRGTDTAFDLLTQTQTPLAGGRLPPFAALDLRVSKRWSARWTQFTAYVDLLHAIGTRVPEPAINGIDASVVVYSYGLPFLPLFGVEGSWTRPRDGD